MGIEEVYEADESEDEDFAGDALSGGSASSVRGSVSGTSYADV